jgi:hypothetical protein
MTAAELLLLALRIGRWSGVLPEHKGSPCPMTADTWRDVVYVAMRLGWGCTHDEDAVCRHIKTPDGKHNIRWDKETRSPYYLYLPTPGHGGQPRWFGTLEEVLREISGRSD